MVLGMRRWCRRGEVRGLGIREVGGEVGGGRREFVRLGVVLKGLVDASGRDVSMIFGK